MPPFRVRPKRSACPWLERVIREACEVVVGVEELVVPAAIVREQRIDHLLFDLRVSGNRPHGPWNALRTLG
jgi:hypothetical protein